MQVKKRDVPFIAVFIIPALILYLMFSFVPNISPVFYSFFRWKITNWGRAPFVGFENYVKMFTTEFGMLTKCIGNNLYFSFFGIGIPTLLSLFIAALVTADRQKPMPEVNIYRSVIYIPNLVSAAAIAMLWSFIYSPHHGIFNPIFEALGLKELAATALLGDTRLVKPAILLSTLWGGIGYYFVIYQSAIYNIPATMYEAAAIDGSGAVKQFWHVTLPLISNTIKTLLMMGCATAFSGGFIGIKIMSDGGPNYASEILTSYMYRQAFQRGDLGYGSALGTFVLVITVVIYLTVTRLFKNRGEAYEY